MTFSRALMFLTCLCITVILVGAILSTKTITVGPWVLPGGAFVFPLCFAILAVVERVYGLRASWFLAQCAVGMLLCTVIAFDVVVALPSPDTVHAQAFAALFASPLQSVGATIFAFALGSGSGIMLLAVTRYRHPLRRQFWIRSYIAPTLSQIVTACAALPLIYGDRMTTDEMGAFLLSRSVFACMYGIFLMGVIQVVVLVISERENPIPIEGIDRRFVYHRKVVRS